MKHTPEEAGNRANERYIGIGGARIQVERRMTIYTLDDSRPFLMRNGAVIKWESGDVAAQIMSSRLVRIYSRGVSFVPLGWKTRNFGPDWSTEDPCWPSRNGLCQTENGTVFFPTSRPPLVGQRLWDWRCKGKSTGRALTDLAVYEASACDVLDAGYDFAYFDGKIMTRDGSMPDWQYWVICVLVIFLVRCLSKYILASLDKETDDQKKSTGLPSAWACVAACVAATVLVTFQGDSCFVTREDLNFYWFSVTYVGFYTALFLVSRTASAFTTVHVPFSSLRDPPFYNLLAGVLQLIATRFYFSADTPYNPPIIFIVAVRAFTKSRRKAPDAVRSCTLLFDGFMLSLLCVLGFWEDKEYLVAVFSAAMAWADYLI